MYLYNYGTTVLSFERVRNITWAILPFHFSSAEQKVRQDWLNHGKVWVDKECFDQCFAIIQPWLDPIALLGHLFRHGVAGSQDDMHVLTNPVDLPSTKALKLLHLAGSAGAYGYYLLYMCIRDTADEQMGHGDAAKELSDYGESSGCLAPRKPHTPMDQLHEQSRV